MPSGTSAGFRKAPAAQRLLLTRAGGPCRGRAVRSWTGEASRSVQLELRTRFSTKRACSTYAINKRITHAACLVHARRRFAKIVKDAPKGSPPGLAHEALKFFAEIYRIEDDIRDADPDHRLQVRQVRTKPVMHDLHDWLAGHAPTVLPKSPLGEAFGYTLSNWAALNTFVEHGIVEADNNLSERALKPVALSRKNWLFAGSERGGPAAAVAFSLIETAKLNGIEPYEYLRDMLARSNPTGPPGRTAADVLEARMTDRPPPMQDAVLIESLNRATSLQLYQLAALLERLVTDPRRIVAIRKDLHLGQVVRFYDAPARHHALRQGRGNARRSADGARHRRQLPMEIAVCRHRTCAARTQARRTCGECCCGRTEAHASRLPPRREGLVH